MSGSEFDAASLDAALGAVDGADPTTVPSVGADGHARFDADDLSVECFSTRLPLEIAQRLRSVPFDVPSTGPVRVATIDPDDIGVIDDLALALGGVEFTLHAAAAETIDAALRRWYRLEARSRDEQVVSEIAADSEPVAAAEDATETGRIGELVISLLNAASAARASDIHFEPAGDALQVRFRVDGVMRHHQQYPRGLASGIVNRVKVLARIDVAERRRLQDGRFSHIADGRILDCRVVTVPTSSGTEGAVVRLLDQGRTQLSLKDLGFSEALRARFAELLDTIPNGTVLVTGPTGAGKTTTLYAALEIVARDDRKTLAIEDPVEVTFDKITQVQVNEAAGLTFAAALRGFLRADPDVMLVGEIRDAETAKLATESALTGHLVLSTLHTNDAAGAPPRLADLGVESFLTASSLRAVLSQRLVRRLCEHCSVPTPVSAEDLAAARWPDGVPAPEAAREAVGCTQCDRSGFKGRVAVGELVVVDAAMAAAITDRVPAAEIERLATEAGTVPLRVEAARLVADGVTSLAEMRRAGL